MGRKRREIDNFIAEWSDLEKLDNALVCKYCKIKLPNQQNRISEHMSSQKHISLKKSIQTNHQLPNLFYRDKKENQIEIYLVSIVIFGKYPFSSIDKKTS